jgi:hypothetical protein
MHHNQASALPERNPEIRQAIADLNSSKSSLDEAVRELLGRIAPVMRSLPPTPVGPGASTMDIKTSPYATEVACSIGSVTADLHQMRLAVESALGRIEL